MYHILFLSIFLSLISGLELSVGPTCSVNTSFFPPLTCPTGYGCCKMPATLVCADEAPPCTSCPQCCHSYLNATECAACNKNECSGHSTVGDAGCNTTSPATWVPWNPSCCARGRPEPASTTLPNCLLIGDSVGAGQFSLAKEMLKNDCQLQNIEGVDSANEAACWGTLGVDTAGNPIEWDVIQFNEGLHSLWPRVNTTEELSAWTGVLTNWTKVLQQAGPPAQRATLIYATMTPMMAEKWCNPPGAPQVDLETKNAVAVATVQAAGVTNINDLYSVVTAHCGDKYFTCDWCDVETQNFCEAYQKVGGTCGFHYLTAGWEALANATATAIRAALKSRTKAL